MADGRDADEVFREFARRYSLAHRAHDRAAATGRQEEIDRTLSMKQALESEARACFVLRKLPDWDAVARAAAGSGA